MRRRPALLQTACEQSCCQDLLGLTSEANTLGPRKLETHIWHAKRMQMVNRSLAMLEPLLLLPSIQQPALRKSHY